MHSAVLPATLSELYLSHRARALAIARRILRDADDAEDVVQDVFMRLYTAPAPFDGKAAYSTWLFRVMVNSSINSLRAGHRRARLRTESQPPLNPEQLAVGSQMKRRFQEALAAVGERHQQVLWLREMRGMSYPEIARLLGIPEGTVKSALNRGRQRLMEILRERGDL